MARRRQSSAIFSWLTWGRRRPLQALAVISVFAVGKLSSTIDKILVRRSRPLADAVSSLVPERQPGSFPLGHTAFATVRVLAGVIVLARAGTQRLLAALAGLVFVALVAFSRLYLGVHYVSDVAGSLVISSAAILAWMTVWNNFLSPRIARPAVIGMPAGPDPQTR